MKVELRGKFLSIVLTFSIILLLIFAFPVAGLKIDITEPEPKILGRTIKFSFTITIEETELLPIQRVNLEIYNLAYPVTYYLICENLPLRAENKAYDTAGGYVMIGAVPAPTWWYGYGYGYVHWESVGYYWGYGYGYGYEGVGVTSIKYYVYWHSLAGWPAGNYGIKATILANGQTFSKTLTVTLSKLPELTTLEAQISALRAEVSLLRTQVENLRAEIEELKTLTAVERAALLTQIRRLEITIDKLEATIKDMEKQIDGLQAEIAELEARAERAEAEARELRGTVRTLRIALVIGVIIAFLAGFALVYLRRRS